MMVLIYAPGWREAATVNVNCLPQEQTQRPQPGLKSRQLDPEFMELNCKH